MESANRGAQKVLTHEFRECPMAQGAVPRRRHGFRRCRFGRQLNRQGPGWGTVMRHFLLPSPVTALPFGVGVTTAQAVLIATAGFLPHQRRRRYIHAGQTGSSLDSFSLPCRPRLAIPAALRLPDNDCCAIHPPEALRAANRKSGIVMPEIQNPKSTPACPARYQDNSSPPDFYGNPTPLTWIPRSSDWLLK